MLRALAVLFLAPILALGEQPQPKPLEFFKWSGDLNVPDPVAISFDTEGRAYVTQTQRRKSQDLDIRQNRDWIPSDVGLQSVSEKVSFYLRELAPGDDEENRKHVQDQNGDGKYDYRDLMVQSEKIHLIQDTDQNGVADSIEVFAEDFRTEVTGIAAGVLHHDGHVYATIAPDVWKLPDVVARKTKSKRTKLASGFGLHIAYAGHDMHGLTVGPDGKIYWSIGDKGISATSKEGTRFHYPNQGGVLRCNPDGSDFEVFAHGLRNVQELAFDQWGNLFGVDNDADKPGERERFVYIVKGMDAGWRCNYQYRGGDYDPWMAERLWEPWHDGQPSYVLPPISHSIDGPAGFAFNPGTALSPAYKDFFFLTGAPNGNQIAFQVEGVDASFKMVREHQIGSGLPLVGINFAPDGGLYAVDWGGGYPLNQTGAVWRIDDPRYMRSEQRREVKELLASGFQSVGDKALVEFLKHADQRVRLGAQFELVQRNAGVALSRAATNAVSELARVHAVWGLGQLARNGNEGAESQLKELLVDAGDAEIVAQVLRQIGDLEDFDMSAVAPFVAHSSPRLRSMALSALGDHPTREEAIWQSLVQCAGNMKMSQTYLRFALARALASCGTEERLTAMKEGGNELLQLASVVALRHRASPALASYLGGTSDVVATEAALAIHDDFSVPVALPELAQALLSSTCESEAFVRRAINANFRIGTPRESQRLVQYAADAQRPIAFRLDALAALALWKNPPALDRVTGRARDWSMTQRRVGEQASSGLSRLLADSDREIKVAAMAAVAALEIRVDASTLFEIVLNKRAPSSVRLQALELLEVQKDELADLPSRLIGSDVVRLRMRGLVMLAGQDSAKALGVAERVIRESHDLLEKQAATRLLGTLQSEAAEKLLAEYLQRMQAGEAGLKEIQLELVESAELDYSASYSECLSGGNAKSGKQLFRTHIGAQCARCHRIGRNGSDVGPKLDGIASKRDAAYLLRAIVTPSEDIEQQYRTTTVLLDSGKSLQGVVVKKTQDMLTLLDSQGKEHEVDVEEIEESFEQKISIMPEMSKVLSRSEIRDLVAYLMTLK